MLKRMTIENFRGYRRLETPKLTQFNIVGGGNDVGKSTLLEAVFLLSGMDRADIATFLNRGRGMVAARSEDLFAIFHGQDVRERVKVQGEFTDGITREVSLTSRVPGVREFQEYTGVSGEGDVRLVPAFVQAFRLLREGRPVAQGDVLLLVDGKGKIRKFSQTGTFHRWPCINVPARQSLTGIRYLKKMFERKRKGVLLAVLQAIDPRIADLTVNGDKIMVDVGLPDSLLPLQTLGDGVVRTVDVLATADACRGGTVCIDEIENGLHHTAMKAFWSALVRFARDEDIQVIATTHNLELMRYIAGETETDTAGDLSYIRLSRQRDGNPSATVFEGRELGRALAMGFEPRG